MGMCLTTVGGKRGNSFAGRPAAASSTPSSSRWCGCASPSGATPGER